jgi:hypothetical protein
VKLIASSSAGEFEIPFEMIRFSAGELELILQRREGITPAQKAAEMEAENAQLRRTLAASGKFFTGGIAPPLPDYPAPTS